MRKTTIQHRPNAGRLLLFSGAALSVVMAGCVFDTAPGYRMVPRLEDGREWLYVGKFYQVLPTGISSDTTVFHYTYFRLDGDTTVNGSRYQILREDNLLAFRDSLGRDSFKILHSLNGVFVDEAGITVSFFKDSVCRYGGGGFPPFKAAAGFDTVHFCDENRTMIFPANENSPWYFRSPGHPIGHSAATKKYVGRERITVNGRIIDAHKFQFSAEFVTFVTTFIWYDSEKMVKTLSTWTDVSPIGERTVRFSEWEYLGSRYFSRADSLSMLPSGSE